MLHKNLQPGVLDNIHPQGLYCILLLYFLPPVLYVWKREPGEFTGPYINFETTYLASQGAERGAPFYCWSLVANMFNKGSGALSSLFPGSLPGCLTTPSVYVSFTLLG